MKAIPYGKQFITQEDIDAVVDVLKSDFLTQGPRIAEFEKSFAEYIGSKYAVAVSNGTAALHLSAMALGVKPGTKVITTPITFAASANCVLYCGGEISFADIEPDTFTLDINKVSALLKHHPKGTFSGIIPVDLAGYPVNLEKFRDLANAYDLWILEDACHALGGYFTDSKNSKQSCGNGIYADLSIFSFHPVKHIATGEGGMITTNNKALHEKLLLLRTHGITKDPEHIKENQGGWYYEMQYLGYNYRLSDLQAVLGSSQLKRAEQNLIRRKQIADRYCKALSNLPITVPCLLEPTSHAYHLFIILTDSRTALYEYLRKNNIYTQVHYIPVHLQPYYKQFGWKKGDFPLAENYYERCLSLPMYPSLTDAEQDYVIEKIIKFYS